MRPILVLSFFLFSCGVSVSDKAKNPTAEVSDTPFTVAQFFPASGNLAALPSTVTITFSQIPQRAMLAAVTHYSLNCGGQTLHAAAVDSTSGYSSVTITLPDMGAVAGASCTLALSPNLLDESGNRLSGARTATYLLAP